jgi:hypothetical protein
MDELAACLSRWSNAKSLIEELFEAALDSVQGGCGECGGDAEDLAGHADDCWRAEIISQGAELLGRELETVARCRVCGCTDNFGCQEPCSWVEADLCSNCVDAAAQKSDERELVGSTGATS